MYRTLQPFDLSSNFFLTGWKCSSENTISDHLSIDNEVIRGLAKGEEKLDLQPSCTVGAWRS